MHPGLHSPGSSCAGPLGLEQKIPMGTWPIPMGKTRWGHGTCTLQASHDDHVLVPELIAVMCGYLWDPSDVLEISSDNDEDEDVPTCR